MASRQIKNLIFDMGGVLVGLDGQRCIQAFCEIGAEGVADYVRYHRVKDLFRDQELGLITSHAFCDEVRKTCAKSEGDKGMERDCPTDEQITYAWNALLLPPTGLCLRSLHRLKAQGYNLFLLSNTNEMHWNRCAEWLPTELFDHIFLSCDMQQAKPDVEIFARVLHEANLKAEETLFIDDSEANCRAAETLGIHTLLNTHRNLWAELLAPVAASIGFFDGVHQGHRHLLKQLRQLSEECKVQSAELAGVDGIDGVSPNFALCTLHSALNSAFTSVITFDLHPRQVLKNGYCPQLLIPSAADKEELLREAGIDEVITLPFNEELSRFTARDFMQRLRDEYNVRLLVLGYDTRFGHNRSETMADYMVYGQELGIRVVQASPLESGETAISSSRIRHLLMDGEIQEANHLLGRPYSLWGTVAHGKGIGRTLGFPTANITPCSPLQQLPKKGVYAVDVEIKGDTKSYRGVMNIGTRPTFHGSHQTLEVHLLHFRGDLYGQQLKVTFLRHLRNERTFTAPHSLAAQIQKDLIDAENA